MHKKFILGEISPRLLIHHNIKHMEIIELNNYNIKLDDGSYYIGEIESVSITGSVKTYRAHGEGKHFNDIETLFEGLYVHGKRDMRSS